MNFLDKLERKFGKYAIENLMLYILAGNAFVFLFHHVAGNAFDQLITFNLNAIMHGQIWRLITFVFIPNTVDPIWFLFSAYLYYSISREIEYAWGSFKFNVYYFLGVFLTMLASSLFNAEGTTFFINLSLFLAYATLFPNVQFRLYFIIPIKVKYLALLDVALILYEFFTGNIVVKVFIIISLLNYFLFFGIPLLKKRSTKTQRTFNKQRRELSKGSGMPIHVAFHKCHVCGKTELSDPEMEFRYCSKCNGNYEYCMDHIKDHNHIE